MISDIPGLTERRQSPRYNIKLTVDIVLPDGGTLNVKTSNISGSGLQISCDSWATDQIEPRGIQNHAINHLHFKVIAELPIEDDIKKLYTSCRIMSVQRMSQDVFMLNLAFIDFEGGSEKVLDEFLGQYVQKKTVIKAFA